VLRFLPPHIMSREHVDLAVKAMHDILTEQDASQHKGVTEWLAKH
jgi:acetylornithine/succinyldiaminopimelate/putrescine aminotransferase